MADLGISNAKEQVLNDGSGLVPADLLVSTWAQGKPCAIDVSIVVSAELTTRGGSSIRSAEDDRAASKMHKYKGLCTTKQWNYQPFVADVYGALSSQARTLLSHYMDSKLNPTVKANPGVCSEVWSGVSGAIVARAGRQWHRMQSMDTPALLPLNCLDWAKRQKLLASHWMEADVIGEDVQDSTGNLAGLQPSFPAFANNCASGSTAIATSTAGLSSNGESMGDDVSES